jgi:hypothetical protein
MYMLLKANKRQKLNAVEEMAALVDLEEGWLDKLLGLRTDKLAVVLGDIANQGNIRTTAIRNARIKLPSSGAKWTHFAESFAGK